MANPEHVEILKSGVEVWNEWRKENPEVVPDLHRTDFHEANLKNINLTSATLTEANFREADLTNANLSRSNLHRSNFTRAKLINAKLLRTSLVDTWLMNVVANYADFYSSTLSNANLTGAILIQSNLQQAILEETNLMNANLGYSNLQNAFLKQTKVENANFAYTQFGLTNIIGVNISECLHLDSIQHLTKSEISFSTILKSFSDIPISEVKTLESFLIGCGLSDWQIESAKLSLPNLSNGAITDIIYKIHDIRTTQAIQISPLFISYTHDDGAFVDKVGEKLTKNGVRFWRDIHHATAGKLEKLVDRAMRLHPTVLLVLSKNSTNSDWVEHEARKARALEKELERDVICPVALDNSWKTCKWPARLREQIEEYNILDFSGWQDPAKFDGMFTKLLQGLDLFYKE